MQSINTVIKFIWLLSILLFLGALFYGYYLLPDVVCIRFSAQGSPTEYWERKHVFYAFVGAFALLNVLILVIDKLFSLIPNPLKPIPNKQFWLHSETSKETLHFVFSNWFYSLLFIVNIAILGVFGVIWKVNYDIQSSILQYAWLPKVIICVLALWVVYLPVRLFISK